MAFGPAGSVRTLDPSRPAPLVSSRAGVLRHALPRCRPLSIDPSWPAVYYSDSRSRNTSFWAPHCIRAFCRSDPRYMYFPTDSWHLLRARVGYSGQAANRNSYPNTLISVFSTGRFRHQDRAGNPIPLITTTPYSSCSLAAGDVLSGRCVILP